MSKAVFSTQGSNQTVGRRRPPTILVVDDDLDQLSLYSALFESLGFTVLTSVRAKEALSILDDLHVDLVICDCVMPEMNGRDFVARVRKSRNLKRLPVVEFSASPLDDDDDDEVQVSGADAFCLKQDHRSLVRTVSDLIQENEEQMGLLGKIRARF